MQPKIYCNTKNDVLNIYFYSKNSSYSFAEEVFPGIYVYYSELNNNITGITILDFEDKKHNESAKLINHILSILQQKHELSKKNIPNKNILKLMEEQGIETDPKKRAEKIKQNIHMFGENHYLSEEQQKRIIEECRKMDGYRYE